MALFSTMFLVENGPEADPFLAPICPSAYPRKYPLIFGLTEYLGPSWFRFLAWWT